MHQRETLHVRSGTGILRRWGGCGLRALLLALLVLSCPLYAAEPVKIGIQAFRSKAQTMQHWQPLAAALEHAIPGRDFVIVPLTNEEMIGAAANRELDFVFTNSGNYMVISKRSGLSPPLATLAEEENGQAVAMFGGVIFCHSRQEKINSLTDLAGKTMAATTNEALGSYRMQEYELSLAGIHFPQEARVIFTGLPQDNVVEAVLSGRADAGFVRTGLLESMAREGRLDMSKLKIINRQNPPGYPLPVSTRLYPNWPFAAMPHVDEKLSRSVAVALLRLEENTAATHAMHIRGFVVAADYTVVTQMLQDLRLPPFDEAPEFTLHDVWKQYRWQANAFLLASGLILVLGYQLVLSNRRLRKEQSMVLQQQHARKQAEDKIIELNRDLERRVVERTVQLEAANRELENFSYSVSHDLRTPLRAIDGFSHLLLADYADKLDDEGRRMLKVVRNNTSRMARLIDDILEFLRVYRLEMNISAIDMEGLARSVMDELKPGGGELRVEIEQIPPCMGDRAMLRLVWANLLANAIKFSRIREDATIKVGSSIEDNETIYYVKDNGVGFDMQYVGKLFGVFQRLHGIEEFDGTGIGLAIVKRVVTRHGGRVWAEGKVNEGATLYFSLPQSATNETAGEYQ